MHVRAENWRNHTDDGFAYSSQSSQEANPAIWSSSIVAREEWNTNGVRIMLHMKTKQQSTMHFIYRRLKYVNNTFIKGSSDMDNFILPTELSVTGFLNSFHPELLLSCSMCDYRRGFG
jgi:hypothetical protein